MIEGKSHHSGSNGCRYNGQSLHLVLFC
ncbi:hypothetical protein MPLSOD_120077 [Mesorhizobium sp. SOD10]|nr:hypothetical protein MPLSOD_120077 [Mesorhizobium sp. SOD10]